MTTQKMTICRLPIKGDAGKFYLKKYFGKIFRVVFLILFLITALTYYIIIDPKYINPDSPNFNKIIIFCFIIFCFALIGIYGLSIRTSVNLYSLPYIFAFDSASNVWLFQYDHPIVSTIRKNNPDKKRFMADLYGITFSLFIKSNDISETARTISYCAKHNIIEYFIYHFDESTNFNNFGQKIYEVSKLIEHKKYFGFYALLKTPNDKQYKKYFRISKNFTNSEELIRVLDNLNNLT